MRQTNTFLSNPFVVFGFIYAVPFLIGVFYAEWTDREFHIHLGWAAISIAYCYLFKFKWPLVLLSAFFVFTSGIDIGYAMLFGGVFTTSSVEAIAQTNIEEVGEFFESYFDPVVILSIVIYWVMSAWLLKRLVCLGKPQKAYQFGIACFFFVVLIGFIVQGLIIKQRYSKLLPGIVGAYPSYLGRADSLTDEINERAKLSSDHEGYFVSKTETPQTYVFIIGEATTRGHMSLYGYKRDTNPLLSKRDDLLVFDNVISTYVQTQPSLRHALTAAMSDGKVPFSKALSIVDAANIAGFDTWWISNQQPLRGTYSAIGQQAKHTTFISNLYFGKEVGRYDGLLLPELDKALQDTAPKKAIFLHFMGSHLKYVKRYPESFDIFHEPPYFGYKANLSDKQKFYINTYDNSIRYNDWVVNEVIERLKHSSKGRVAALSYFADHGEEVFDAIDFKGHGPDTITKNSVEIPFVVWLSDKYKNDYPDSVSNLKKNLHKPYTLDEYFHFSISQMNLLSPMFKPELSLFSQQPLKEARMVYGVNYDEAYKKEKSKKGS